MGGATAGALSAALILRLGPRLSQDDQGRSGRVRAGPSGPALFLLLESCPRRFVRVLGSQQRKGRQLR